MFWWANAVKSAIFERSSCIQTQHLKNFWLNVFHQSNNRQLLVCYTLFLSWTNFVCLQPWVPDRPKMLRAKMRQALIFVDIEVEFSAKQPTSPLPSKLQWNVSQLLQKIAYQITWIRYLHGNRDWLNGPKSVHSFNLSRLTYSISSETTRWVSFINVSNHLLLLQIPWTLYSKFVLSFGTLIGSKIQKLQHATKFFAKSIIFQ